tara:strand:+ start:419 stop:1690 length:1272 start_codon:yes stop_codon:yes gene_type:complete
MNPAAIALALQGVSLLGNLGSSLLGRNDARDARRKAEEENKKRIAEANLSRAFGGNPAVDLVQPKLKQGLGTKILGGIGTAAGVGAQGLGIYNQAKALQGQAATRKLQNEALEFDRGKREGFESVLSNGGATTSILGDIGAAGAKLSTGGDTPANALQLPEVPVVSSPLPSAPGFTTGAHLGRQSLQKEEIAQLTSMLPFMEFRKEQNQLATLVGTIERNPQALDQLGADARERVMPYLSPGAMQQALGRKLSEKGIETITNGQAVTEKVVTLQAMMEEAVARNITGPIKGTFNEFLDSNGLIGGLTQDQRSDFKNLADDELLVRINNTSESLIPTMRKATNETGVMTEKDEDRIRRQFPSTSGFNDTRELAKLPRLINEVNAVMGSHMKALEGQNFLIGTDSFGATDNELIQEFIRRQGRNK